HEEAAQAQARRLAGGKAGKAGFTIQWLEAKNAWGKYIKSYALAPAGVETRLQSLRVFAQRRDAASLQNLMSGTQNLMSDLHKGMTARFYLAAALDAAGDRATATKELQTLADQISALDKTTLAKDYAEFASGVRGTILARALNSFAKDLGGD